MASIEQPACKISDERRRSKPTVNLFKADLALRLLLLVAAVAVLVLMLTGDQTVHFGIPFSSFSLTLSAKYNYSPAFVYLLVALAVAAVYSLLTAVVAALSVRKPSPPAKLLFLLTLLDVIMLGVVASATGAGASVGYVGLKGNSHTGWMKICNIYGDFCRHVGVATIVSLVSSFILILLVIISTYSLYRRSS